LLDRKIYKTGQTRGADDEVIFQNRVARNSTVLIPYSLLNQGYLSEEISYENGFIVLISPKDYFSSLNTLLQVGCHDLVIGENILIFYEKREDWIKYNPINYGWYPATQRKNPLGGQYVARISATTANQSGGKIHQGFTDTKMKGAGIRVYEYADKETIEYCRIQLEALFWMCKDAKQVVATNGMTESDITLRQSYNFSKAHQHNLLNTYRLKQNRILNKQNYTVCPLCLEVLSGHGFFNRMEQAQGREVHDLTITQINLFHIQELRYGRFNHRPHNLGWGHHHCNVVIKDSGIAETLKWMQSVLQRNIDSGYISASNKPI